MNFKRLKLKVDSLFKFNEMLDFKIRLKLSTHNRIYRANIC